MKRTLSLLISILLFQSSYGIMAVFSDENNDTQAIKMTVMKHYESFANQDLDSAMQQISKNYLETEKDGKMIDYANFKLRLENWIKSLASKSVDWRLSEINFLSFNIQGNKATAEVEFTWKLFDLDILTERTRKLKRSISLTKEDGQWKIENIKLE